MRRIIICFFIFNFNYAHSQNIILNGDFEANKLPYIKRGELNVLIETYSHNWKTLYPNIGCNYIKYNLSDTSKRIWTKEKWVKPFKNNSFLGFFVSHFRSGDTLAFYLNSNNYLQAATSQPEGAIKQKMRLPLIKDTNYIFSYRLQSIFHNKFFQGQRVKNLFGFHFSR